MSENKPTESHKPSADGPCQGHVTIRPEQPADVDAIARVTEAAFRKHPISRQTEHFIVRELRRTGGRGVS